MLTGGCACGAVRYEIDAPLRDGEYCHCRRCQRRTGTAASASAEVDASAFRVVAGADRLGRWTSPTGWQDTFCGVCGSALFALGPDGGEVVAVGLGGVDGDPGIRPGHRQFVASAAPWEPIPDDGLPRFDEGGPA